VSERFHIDGSLEHEESVSAIVGVEFLAICAKVLGTERTAVPLANDTPHMPVAESKGMCEVMKISCRVTWCVGRRASWRGSSGISI
jgi:hypothetical protein